MRKLKYLFLIIVAVILCALPFAACSQKGGQSNGSQTNDSQNGTEGSQGNGNQTGGSQGNGNQQDDPSGNGQDEVESGASQGNSGNGQEDGQQSTDSSNVLVAYFSCTQNTEGVAIKIADAAKGTLYEIVPAVPYTSADLNYTTDCRANREQNDSTARPGIASAALDIQQYDVVFLGYPIWWGKLPKIVYTFLDKYDLSGKTVIPFCTSGGSGIETSVSEIKREEPNATVTGGRRFEANVSVKTVADWVDGLQLNIEKEIKTVNIYCGSNKLEIELADNPSAKEFVEKLKEGDVTVKMDDYGNFEKVGKLGFYITPSDEDITTEPGDVILYLGSNITVYYDTNSYNFTLLGKIKGATRDSILNGFFGGKGDRTVTFSLK